MEKIENKHLSESMSVTIIRDMIMDLLAPMDVVNFVIGTGIRFVSKDMERYISLFKYIIPNRRWLQSKIKANYMFTVVSKDLNRLINTNGYDIRRRISMRTPAKPRIDPVRIDALLIVTLNAFAVPCTSSFLTGSGLKIIDGDPYFNAGRSQDPNMFEVLIADSFLDKVKNMMQPLIIAKSSWMMSTFFTTPTGTKVEYMLVDGTRKETICTSVSRTMMQHYIDEAGDGADALVMLVARDFDGPRMNFRVHLMNM
ncbi:hypothetical protein LTR48_005074 [Friedmanniomyces endolithicus]|uniref:Uncharacterized protein n=1 Tax=Rachicladosporium monterosium TaxID=1507873 RepID=A0ABR0L8U7_9PEZI|nr:hypothetical protein LTR48_005074 [Friedmanniomyces endolithicus]KAK5145268.1 hypothetical protein LTR32_002949 [Rachicladosporium monterosium]